MQTDSPEKNDNKAPEKKGFKDSVRAIINKHRQHLAIAAFFAGMLLFIFISGMKYDAQQTVRYIDPLTSKIIGDSSEKSENYDNSESLTDSKISENEKQFPLDINKATYSQLCEIEGIGGKTAGAIISFRSEHGVITSIEQLAEISGFGEKTVKLLSEYLYVSDDCYIPYTTPTRPVENTSSQTKTEKSKQEKTVTKRARVETEPPQTSPPETESSQFSEPAPTRRPVNINRASAEEIADCLLLTLEKAQDIVAVREQIGVFSNVNELFLVDSLTEEEIAEIAEFAEI